MTARCINELLSHDRFLEDGVERLKQRVSVSQKSKFITYKLMNPDLCVHSVYSRTSIIPDHLRTWFSRFRLSSHRLRVETGRWSRTPREDRLCMCGSNIQDEQHVIQFCPLVQDIRAKHNAPNILFPEFVIAAETISDFQIIYDMMQFFQ